jgi:hypothetical protein
MKIKCNRCQQPLVKPGALVFSPPQGPWQSLAVLKFHICAECWPEVAMFVQGIATKRIVGRKPKASKNPVLFVNNKI